MRQGRRTRSASCGCFLRFGLRGFDRLRLCLRLFVVRLRLRGLPFFRANFDRALYQRPVFDAHPRGYNVSGHTPFTADVQPIRTMDVASHSPHNYYFLGRDIGHDDCIAPNSDAAVSEINRAFNSSIDIERFSAADITLDHDGASNRGLLHGTGYVFGWRVRRWRFCVVGGIVRWLQHQCRPSFSSVRLILVLDRAQPHAAGVRSWPSAILNISRALIMEEVTEDSGNR